MAQSKSATFCDVDETLYQGVMLRDAAKWLGRHGVLPRGYYLKVVYQLLLRKLGLLDHQKAFEQGVHFLAGRQLTDVQQMMSTIYQEELQDGFLPELPALVAGWKQTGPLVLATESLALLAAPVAEAFGFEAVIGTELEVKDGLLTGKLASNVLKGDHKLAAVRAWAGSNNVDVASSTAVGGRVEDVPLLELVGKAVMLKPNAAARVIAQQRSWTVID